jgi:hypothetical protein
VATWLSYDQEKFQKNSRCDLPEKYGADGAFAACCQKLFKVHRLPFYYPSSLAKWEAGGPATTALSTEGKQMHSCNLTD